MTNYLPLDVEEILDEAIDKDPKPSQAKFPVIVETTERHLVWIEADSQDEAVESLNDDPEWYEAISPATRMEYGFDYSISEPNEWEWDTDVYSYSRSGHGPVRRCGECGDTARQYAPSYLRHEETCSQFDSRPLSVRHPAPTRRAVEDVQLPDTEAVSR